MNVDTNELGQEVGPTIKNWDGAQAPKSIIMTGHYCELKPFDLERDAKPLYDSFDIKNHLEDWTYLYNGPFDDFMSFKQWLQTSCCSLDPLFFTIFDKSSNEAVGLASYLRIKPAVGVIEVGSIHFSHLMQQSPMSTEAMFLMMSHIFDNLNYRRYEWKTDSYNLRSRNSALRLGFTFEGIFKQAAHYKGRNRDTAWYAIIDSQWPQIKSSFEKWLHPSNFDNKGQQLKSLGSFSAAAT